MRTVQLFEAQQDLLCANVAYIVMFPARLFAQRVSTVPNEWRSCNVR